jgi:hypothetical protein
VTRHFWKNIGILLAISTLAIASGGFAQQSKGSSDSLQPSPDSGRRANAAKESASGSEDFCLSALDPEQDGYKSDAEKWDVALGQADSVQTLKDLAAGGDSSWTPARLGRAEAVWVAILAGGGFLVSLAAAGYVWWSRARLSKADAPVLLSTGPMAAGKPDSVEEHDETPKRRAA